MKKFQILLFLLGVASFLSAIFFIGDDMGNTLWRAGVAFMLIDIVWILLWNNKN